MGNLLLLIIIFFPIFAGILTYIFGKISQRYRDVVAISSTIIELILICSLFAFKDVSTTLLNLSFKADGFRLVYALISVFVWMCTTIFSKQYMLRYRNKNRYYLFYLLTLSATLGVFFSNSLWTTFMFFEMMSLTSMVLIVHNEKPENLMAAKTYLIISIVSGMIMLFGLVFIQYDLKTTDLDIISLKIYDGFSTNTYIGASLMMVGFAAKAGMYPLHIWLPKAHSVAPAPASALLSGILTKTGIFGIIICSTTFFKNSIMFASCLLVLAVITMLLGAILAIFANDIKRTLACSSVSQLGFILVSISMLVFLKDDNILAFEGTFLHMLNHSLVKLSLFILAGVIFMNTHKLNLNEIRGFGRKKPLLKICFIIAGLFIMGVPLFSGYLSKTLIHEAIVEYSLTLNGFYAILIRIVEAAFLFTGGLTVAYILKLFVCVFVEKNNNEKLQNEYDNKSKYMDVSTTIVVILSTLVLLFVGLIPTLITNNILNYVSPFFNLSEKVEFINYYSFTNLFGSIISIIIGIVVYFVFIRKYIIRRNNKGLRVYTYRWPNKFDLETLVYRPIFYNNEGELNKLSYLIIFIVKALASSLDYVIYIFKKYILRQYKYQFDGFPLVYKIGFIWAKRRNKKEKSSFAYRLLVRKNILKEVEDTLVSTFAFDFLMACIGIVVLLICMLV